MHNDFLTRLGPLAIDRDRDIIEYVRRDIANVVLGNTDNHARNTAIQRRADGTIAMTLLELFKIMARL